MKTKIVLLFFYSLLAFSSIPLIAQQKNVLIIFSDDHSYHALGAAGNKQVKTPHLDRLAKSGCYFTQTYVMGGNQGAICTPSRAMMLTGSYLHRLYKDGATIPDSITSLPEVLRANGYHTFHTGKWHNDKASHHRMFTHGDKIFFGGMHFEKEGGQHHPKVYPFQESGIYTENMLTQVDTYSSELYTDGAIRFIKSTTAKEKPWLCYLALTSPHDPRTPPSPFDKMYDPDNIKLPPNYLPQHPFDLGTLDIRDELLLPRPITKGMVQKEIADYYGMISELDYQVGRILTALKENDFDKNTLIVFAGDNGLAVGQHGLLGKQNLYEHSIKVPMIFSGPDIPKSKYNGFTYLSDMAPTILEYLGIYEKNNMEGISHYKVFKNTNQKIRSHLYNVYSNLIRSYTSDDGFKLILYRNKDLYVTQLYNLKKDPWESNNLSLKKNNINYKINILKNELKMEMEKVRDPVNLDWFLR